MARGTVVSSAFGVEEDTLGGPRAYGSGWTPGPARPVGAGAPTENSRTGVFAHQVDYDDTALALVLA